MKKLNTLAVTAALLVGFSGPALAGGDAEKGKVVFQQCANCHMVGPDAATKVGPQLNGVVGRKAASADYPMYSNGMKILGKLGVVWNEENLDTLIADPSAVIPGSSMTLFHGVEDDGDRADVIAYLKTFSN